ncbi:MAG: methylenetetrahydrofolate reductase [Woeseiaceae bacterium]
MNTFREAMRSKDFVLTATLPLKLTATAGDIRTSAEKLREVVDAVHIAGDRSATGLMDALAVARLVIDEGLDAVVHVDCRDRNRVGLQGALLGLAALGVTSVVLSRGQKLPDELRGKVKGVFDTGTLQLIEMCRRVGADPARVSPPGTYMGSRVSAMRPADDWKASAAQKRIDAGVQFLQALPCLNMGMLQAYVGKLIALRITHRASILVDVPVLDSVEAAERIKSDYPGSRIPRRIVRRLASVRDARAEGIAIAADALRELRAMPGVAGANLILNDDPDTAAEVVSARL